jgi:hypothetical protein
VSCLLRTVLLPLLLAANAWAAEPAPVTVLEKFGPVIDRVEAADLGLFKYRANFGALRFVRADSGRFEARVASRVGGVMLEQAVPLDSPAMARVEQGLIMLRDRSATNVELLLSPRYPLDISCLGPATDIRAATGAVCFGLLGVGAGSTVAMHTVVEYRKRGDVIPNWPAYAAVTATGALLVGTVGWIVGSHADAGRPARPTPRCAIAGYDDFGYPFYEEDVRQVLRSQTSVHATTIGLAIGILAGSIASSIVQSSFDHRTYSYATGIVCDFPKWTAMLGTMVTTGLVANTIGRDMDREVAIEKLRNRPRPENSH